MSSDFHSKSSFSMHPLTVIDVGLFTKHFTLAYSILVWFKIIVYT